MTTEKAVQAEAARLGVPLSTYSPGDGITRYRFGGESNEYFASSAWTTVLGSHDAMTWLAGYGHAYSKAAEIASEKAWQARLLATAEDGRQAGYNAATWILDGNSTTDQARSILDAIESCDFDFPSPLSGEWAGESISELLGDLDDLDDDEQTELSDAYEQAYLSAYETEAVRSARAMLSDAVAS